MPAFTGTSETGGIGEFLFKINLFEKLAMDKVNEVCRDATVELTKRIVATSPVDTTRPDDTVFKGDWNADVGTIPGDVDNNDPSGQSSIDAAQDAVDKWVPTAGQTYYLVNHKPYALMLEYGWYSHDPKSGRTTEAGFSTQAPGGVVGVYMMEWPDIVAEAARKAGA